MERARQGLNKNSVKRRGGGGEIASRRLRQAEADRGRRCKRDGCSRENLKAAAQLKETAAAPASTDAPFQEPPANSETKPKKMTAPFFPTTFNDKKDFRKERRFKNRKKDRAENSVCKRRRSRSNQTVFRKQSFYHLHSGRDSKISDTTFCRGAPQQSRNSILKPLPE